MLAHAWHLHKDQDRKKYKLMNEFCVFHGLLDRSPDQYKYVLQKKQVVIDACNRKDKWDDDVENAITKELRIGKPTPAVKTEAAVSSQPGLSADHFSNLQHNKRVRELLGDQNKWLCSIAKSLKWFDCFIYFTLHSSFTDCFSFPSISGRDKTTKPLVRTKAALEGLLNPEQQEDDAGSNTDDDEEDADNEPKSQPSDAAQLETGKRSGEEATTAQLEKEKTLVDARQTVNKEKARAELEKKEQKKQQAAALKLLKDEEKRAEKASLQDTNNQARASGISKRARK